MFIAQPVTLASPATLSKTAFFASGDLNSSMVLKFLNVPCSWKPLEEGLVSTLSLCPPVLGKNTHRSLEVSKAVADRTTLPSTPTLFPSAAPVSLLMLGMLRPSSTQA